MESGIELIIMERQRQIQKEGWSAKHDDNHGEGQIALAAACYALAEENRRITRVIFQWWRIGQIWPWAKKWWKPTPKNRIKELVKAGALIAAEIDRLQRLKK